MYVAHNIFAMNAQRQYNISTSNKSKSTEKLSSGYRINRAADDAAGLSISEKMRKQVRGLSRASENCQDGISLVQVADGALAETHAILQRMNELAVQSANGTNSATDRAAIDNEKKELVKELNKIANTTTFNNDIYPLCGLNKEDSLKNIPMKTVSYENVSYDDIQLGGAMGIAGGNMDTHVNWSPFSDVRDFDSLKLQAVIDDKNGIFTTDTYNMIYGNGSTSHSRIRLTDAQGYVNANGQTNYEQYDVEMNDFHYDEGSYVADETTKTWSRSFSWTSENGNIGARITQKVQIDDANKNYIITNEITSIGTQGALFEFMVNIDTAYNNNDLCEGYFTDGNELTDFSIFNTDASENELFQDWIDTTQSSSIYDSTHYPNSISIVNREFGDLLPFTEKIAFGSNKPVISMERWGSNAARWDYYKTTGNTNGLGNNAIGKDRALTLIWSSGKSAQDVADANQQKSYAFTFTYGVDDVRNDANLPVGARKTFKTIQVPDWDAYAKMQKDEPEDNTLKIWARASSDVENGIYIRMVDATAETLGVADVDLSTEEGATNAIDQIKEAIDKTSAYRSYFGAVQNRMEHSIQNLDNVVENTDAAESRIRDTDMAKEMVDYSKENILEQVGQSMLAQANQSTQGVLTLLQ